MSVALTAQRAERVLEHVQRYHPAHDPQRTFDVQLGSTRAEACRREQGLLKRREQGLLKRSTMRREAEAHVAAGRLGEGVAALRRVAASARGTGGVGTPRSASALALGEGLLGQLGAITTPFAVEKARFQLTSQARLAALAASNQQGNGLAVPQWLQDETVQLWGVAGGTFGPPSRHGPHRCRAQSAGRYRHVPPRVVDEDGALAGDGVVELAQRVPRRWVRGADGSPTLAKVVDAALPSASSPVWSSGSGSPLSDAGGDDACGATAHHPLLWGTTTGAHDDIGSSSSPTTALERGKVPPCTAAAAAPAPAVTPSRRRGRGRGRPLQCSVSAPPAQQQTPPPSTDTAAAATADRRWWQPDEPGSGGSNAVATADLARQLKARQGLAVATGSGCSGVPPPPPPRCARRRALDFGVMTSPQGFSGWAGRSPAVSQQPQLSRPPELARLLPPTHATNTSSGGAAKRGGRQWGGGAMGRIGRNTSPAKPPLPSPPSRNTSPAPAAAATADYRHRGGAGASPAARVRRLRTVKATDAAPPPPSSCEQELETAVGHGHDEPPLCPDDVGTWRQLQARQQPRPRSTSSSQPPLLQAARQTAARLAQGRRLNQTAKDRTMAGVASLLVATK